MRWPAETSTPSASVPLEERDLRARVTAEFQELPGLRLTIGQAVRLFHHDRAQCERVLGVLVDRGELVADGEAFARAPADIRVPPHVW